MMRPITLRDDAPDPRAGISSELEKTPARRLTNRQWLMACSSTLTPRA